MSGMEDLGQARNEHALAFLVGTWTGEGKGVYPTIEPFSYREEVTFAPTPKPFLTYSQRTWDAGSGEPLHSESGFWRMNEAGIVEVMIAQPIGIVEIQHGRIDGTAVTLHSTSVSLSQTAKDVREVRRRFTVSDGEMQYDLAMAAVGHRLQEHLRATLRRK